MKLSKISCVFAVAASLLALTVDAQPTNRPPAGARQGGMRGVETQMAALTEQLKLTDEQKPKVKAVLEEQNKKISELRGDSALGQEDRRTKMQGLRQETTEKMKKVLTADQFKKYEEYQQQQRNRGPRNPPGAPATGAGAENGNATKPAP